MTSDDKSFCRGIIEVCQEKKTATKWRGYEKKGNLKKKCI